MPIIASTANSMGWVQVPCTINAKPVNLNFDSGAQLSAIGVNIAKQLAIATPSLVGRINVQGSVGQGVVSMPLAEVSMSIAGGAAFRTRVILDNLTGFNGLIGRNDLNTTHSICFQPNGVTQLFPLYSGQKYVKLASSSALSRMSGTINGYPVSMLFDSGAVGSPASTAISQGVANSAKVMNFIGTSGVTGITGSETGAQIGIVNMTIDGSRSFQTYVDVDPQLSEQCLLSRQDLTRVYSACLGPGGLTKNALKVPQISLPSSGVPATSYKAPETSPTPKRIVPVPTIDPVILGAGGFIVVVLAVMLFRRR